MKPFRILIADLHAAAPTKPLGYLDAVIEAGQIEGDDLLITRRSYLALCARYRQAGDAVAVAAQPVAKALGISPGCGGCSRRGKALNRGATLIKPKN
jgi:hypothetical protein